MKMQVATRLAVGLSAILFCLPLSARTWTDASGKYKVEAELLKVESDRIQLKKANGVEIWVPMTRLSKADQGFVKLQSAKKPAETASAAPAGLKVKGSAQWSNMIRMDENQKQLPPDLEVQVIITGKPAVEAVAIGKLKVDGVTDATGKPLEITESFDLKELQDGFAGVDRSGMFDEHPKDGVLVAIPVKAAQGTKLVGGAKGSVTLKTGGERHSVVVKDAAKQVGKPINDKMLSAAKVKVTVNKVEGKQIEVQIVGEQSTVTKLSIVDAAGKQIGKKVGHGGWGDNYTYTLQSSKPLPADVAVQIDIATGLQELAVPFSLEKLKVEKKKPMGGMFNFK